MYALKFDSMYINLKINLHNNSLVLLIVVSLPQHPQRRLTLADVIPLRLRQDSRALRSQSYPCTWITTFPFTEAWGVRSGKIWLRSPGSQRGRAADSDNVSCINHKCPYCIVSQISYLVSFNFLCSVDRASLYNLVNETNMVHNILSIFRQFYL